MKSRIPNRTFVCLSLLLLLPCVTLGQAVSQKSIMEDIQQFQTELPKRHVDLFHKLSEADFKKQMAAIESKAAGLDKIQLSLELSKVLASVGDGHCAIAFDVSQFHFLPVNFKTLEDGIFIGAIDKPHSKLLKAKVLRIGGVKADDLMANLGKLIPHDNRYALMKYADNMLNAQEILETCGCKSENGTFDLELQVETGEPKNVKLKALDQRTIRSDVKWEVTASSFTVSSKKDHLSHWNDFLEGDTLYFKYNRCSDIEGLKKLVNGTAGFITQKRGQVKRFIVDLRDNGGGDSRVIRPLLKYLVDSKEWNQKGKLFVITGRRTFSSAVLNAMELKSKANAILVGEPPSGRPNHFGELKFMKLKITGIGIAYSTKKFEPFAGGDPDELPLDVPVLLMSHNWFSEQDPFLHAIKNYSR